METFYTGGGIWITTYTYTENRQTFYLSISDEYLKCITKFKMNEEMFMPEDMVETYGIHEKGFEKYKEIYEIMKENHLKEKNKWG